MSDAVLHFIKGTISSRSDYIGASASTLCMIHCLITPLFFAAQATSLSCADLSPLWWKTIDYLFLLVGFIAIYYTSKNTTASWIPYALFISWLLLVGLVLNNSAQWISLPHALMYIPALSMALVHLYNKKYCQCLDTTCCVTMETT